MHGCWGWVAHGWVRGLACVWLPLQQGALQCPRSCAVGGALLKPPSQLDVWVGGCMRVVAAAAGSLLHTQHPALCCWQGPAESCPAAATHRETLPAEGVGGRPRAHLHLLLRLLLLVALPLWVVALPPCVVVAWVGLRGQVLGT